MPTGSASSHMLSPNVLDTILGLQLTIAWAGEKAEDPQRLGWWNTDLTDEAAGGDLFQRLLPKTAAWAGLELAREAALRTDRRARQSLSSADQTLTLFHFGFELDEAIQDRLEHHKRHGRKPSEALSTAWGVAASWNATKFEAFLKALGEAKSTDTPAGRKLKLLDGNPAEAARSLAAALLPLADKYPLPHGDMPKDMPKDISQQAEGS